MTAPVVDAVCVDIGNSGMRCVLRPASSSTQPVANPLSADKPLIDKPLIDKPLIDKPLINKPWMGELLRIDWPENAADTNIGELLHQQLTYWLPKPHRPMSWFVSSVQRAMEGQLESYVSSLGGQTYHRVVHSDLKLNVDVEFPEKVGIDRLLAALAALHHLPDQRLIVIQAGSAITVDLMEPPRTFCGGAIMPGVPMMLRLLSKAADLLPEVAAKELLNLPSLPGKNTTAAMNAGVSSAVVGGVQHLVERYRQQHGRDTLVVLSGGDGPLLGPHLSPPVKTIDHLVLRGVALLSLNSFAD